MALVSGYGANNAASHSSPPMASVPLTDMTTAGAQAYAGQPPDYEPETGGPTGRKMSRIDAKSVVGTDSDSDMTVGKQMELEAGNAIKYRTCSWPKSAINSITTRQLCKHVVHFRLYAEGEPYDGVDLIQFV
ncbi:hypothetical protein LTR66_014266 [Elasticomyces elasticus]|nr:hypothetical protein LTR66_014266 [Elasticomyces elasticus]